MQTWLCLILLPENHYLGLNGTKESINAKIFINKEKHKWISMKFRSLGKKLKMPMIFLTNYQMKIWKNIFKKLGKSLNLMFFQRNKWPSLNSAYPMKQSLQFLFQRLKLEVSEYGWNITKALMNFLKKRIFNRLINQKILISKIFKMMKTI